MKEQILQILLRIASGEAIAQGEKTVYPAVREQLAAIKAIMTLQGWDSKEAKKKAVAPEETPLEATADTTIVEETSVQREQEFTTGEDVTPDAADQEEKVAVVAAEVTTIPTTVEAHLLQTNRDISLKKQLYKPFKRKKKLLGLK
ncbi:hypothetical protein [Capnocytophaga gingivalis]|uniref:hypothetical protein n=1 Tax=Capnocytophaga gingivalis TaxID=1017 RepID=UPI001CAE505F|nr:hypothetical protein [Capnocytophaga gingivalis]MBF1125382.1 hypothetical protein [Capnocytophaga sp.]